jgi:spore cortex biosynthesis protein YabQ
VTLTEQWMTSFYMFLAGLSLGILYDFLRVTRRQIPAMRPLFWSLDVIYWISATIVICSLLYSANHGQFRIYIFLFVFIGGWLYFRWMSSFTMRFMVFLFQIFKKLFLIVIWPIQVMLWKPLRWIIISCKNSSMFIINKYKRGRKYKDGSDIRAENKET